VIWASGAAEGFVVGLAASGSCLATCAPALVPVLAEQGSRGSGPWRALLGFLSGRALGYIVVLSAAAALGREVGPAHVGMRYAAGVAMVVLAAVVGLYAMGVNVPEARVCRWTAKWEFTARAPVAFGLLVGLSPCAPLLLECAAVARGANASVAAAHAAAFIVATSIPTVGLAVFGLKGVATRIVGFARAASAVAAVWFLGLGIAILRGGP